MAYDLQLAQKVRNYLHVSFNGHIEEKKMFGGLAFLLNDKMCVNISGDRLMCRFDPKLAPEVSGKKGYQPMNMRGRNYAGYCYVEPTGFEEETDFIYWLNLCINFNQKAESSKAKKKTEPVSKGALLSKRAGEDTRP